MEEETTMIYKRDGSGIAFGKVDEEYHYEKWCRELENKGEETLEKPVTRKEHVRSIIEVRCDLDKIITRTTVAIVLGIIDLLGLIIITLAG